MMQRGKRVCVNNKVICTSFLYNVGSVFMKQFKDKFELRLILKNNHKALCEVVVLEV